MGRRSSPISGDVFYNKFLGQVYFDCTILSKAAKSARVTKFAVLFLFVGGYSWHMERMKQLFG